MAKNKVPKAPPPSPKEKANESYKVHKEYRKLQKRDKLPGFIITIIVFVIFVGVFAGLYTQFNFELDFDYKEYEDIDISTSSDILSGQLQNAFLSFFTTLSKTSSLASNTVSTVFTDKFSENTDVSIYLLTLSTSSEKYITENYSFFNRLRYKDKLHHVLSSYGDPSYTYLFQLVRGRSHLEYSHLSDLTEYSRIFGWDSNAVHLKFVELNICHVYNGEKFYCCSLEDLGIVVPGQ